VPCQYGKKTGKEYTYVPPLKAKRFNNRLHSRREFMAILVNHFPPLEGRSLVAVKYKQGKKCGTHKSGTSKKYCP